MDRCIRARIKRESEKDTNRKEGKREERTTKTKRNIKRLARAQEKIIFTTKLVVRSDRKKRQ